MSTIKLKRSETAAATPASLEYGEVAINITDKKIYIGNSSENAILIVDGNNTTSEGVQDTAASLFTSGTHTGITVSYPDTNNAINLVNTGVLSFNTRTGAVTLTSSDVTTALGFTPISGVSTETIQDAAASLFTSGTHTGITVSYPDTNNAINLSIDSTVVTLTGTQTLTNKTLTSPTLVTPTLGVASATSINKVAFTAPATGSTLTIADGKTLTASNTLTFTGTDSSSIAFGAGGTVAYTANKLSVFAATTSSELAGVISDETGSGVLVFGTSPAFTTSITTGSTSFDVFDTTATTVNAFGAATTLNLGQDAITGSTTTNINVKAGGSSTVNIATGAAGNRTINLANNAVGNRTVNLLANNYFDQSYSISGGAITAKIGDSIDTNNQYGIIEIGANATGSALTDLNYISIGTPGLSSTAIYGSVTVNSDTGFYVTSSDGVKDGVLIIARSGGTTSRVVSITPASLSGNRVLTLPDTTGTVITTGDTGTVTNTMLAGSIANNKLTNSAITINSSSTSLGGSVTLYLGTTTLQTSSTNQAITGISSIAFSDGTTQTTGASSGADYLLFAMGII